MATTLKNPSVQTINYLSSEFVEQREKCWVSCKDQLVFVGCSDDRPITEESASTLNEQFSIRGQLLDPQTGYASIFGGLAGEAKNVLVVGSAQYGKKFITDMGGMSGIIERLIRQSRDPQTLHSAAANEKNQRYFCMFGMEPTGCLYTNAIGLTSAILTDKNDETVLDNVRADQKYIFGSDKGFEELMEGHKQFLLYATKNKKARYNLNRAEYIDLIKRYDNLLGIMMLDWDHASAKTTGVISNFSLDEVGSSNKAHDLGLDFYRMDIAKVTQVILEALENGLMAHGYTLSAEMLMRSFQMDSVAVRALLVSRDNDPDLNGHLDPASLPVGKRGNVWEAIDKLQQK